MLSCAGKLRFMPAGEFCGIGVTNVRLPAVLSARLLSFLRRFMFIGGPRLASRIFQQILALQQTCVTSPTTNYLPCFPILQSAWPRSVTRKYYFFPDQVTENGSLGSFEDRLRFIFSG